MVKITMWNIRICWETPFYCHVNGANDDDCSTNHEIDSVVFPTFSVTKWYQMYPNVIWDVFRLRICITMRFSWKKTRCFIKKNIHVWNPPIFGNLLFYGVFSPMNGVFSPTRCIGINWVATRVVARPGTPVGHTTDLPVLQGPGTNSGRSWYWLNHVKPV